jgi:diacylglycerol kinase (ATP)
MDRMYFIVNLQAKNGRCRKVWQKIEQELKKQHIPFHAFFTEYRGHAAELADKIGRGNAGREPVLLIAVGGDGTIHEAANGAASYSHITLGFIPGGSGNDFSRGYGIPGAPKKALELVLRSFSSMRFQAIDAGKMHLNGKDIYFVNNMGAGFDALVAKESNESRMKALLNRFSMGRLVYVYILIKELISYKRTDMQINIDGILHHFSKVWFVTVSNQKYYGGGMKIAPKASPTDGMLEITIVHGLAKWKLLLVFITVFWGGHTRFKEVCSLSGKKVGIAAERPVAVHADGEAAGTAPLEVQIQEQAFKILSGKQAMEERAG